MQILKNKFIDICHRVYKNGFVAAYDGNISQRLSDNKILITPSAKCKGDVQTEDLLIIDLNGNLLQGKGKVSTEAKMHLIAYNNRPDVKAVIHAHPVYATAFAAMGQDFIKPVFPEIALTLGKIHLCEYGTPSTNQLADSLLPYIEYAKVLLLENHGAITFGSSLEDAYYKMEKLEHLAKIMSVIRSMGKENLIPKEKLTELYNIADSTYNLKIDNRNRMDI